MNDSGCGVPGFSEHSASVFFLRKEVLAETLTRRRFLLKGDIVTRQEEAGECMPVHIDPLEGKAWLCRLSGRYPDRCTYSVAFFCDVTVVKNHVRAVDADLQCCSAFLRVTLRTSGLE